MLRKFPLQIVRAAQFVRGQSKEPLIFRPQHDDIQIIIPRDESAMPHSAQRRPGKKRIYNVMLPAHAVDLMQHLQQGQLMLAQCARLRFEYHRYFFNPLIA